MKKLFIFSAFIACCFTVSANSYKLDDTSIDIVIANATEISVDQADAASPLAVQGVNATLKSNPNPWVAWLICWVGGEFGIHRYYLGTRNQMWMTYTCTVCGIFGIVPLVDWVVLLIGAIKDDVSKYENNTKFFMW